MAHSSRYQPPFRIQESINAFGAALVERLGSTGPELVRHPNEPCKVMVRSEAGDIVSLDLRPFDAKPQPPSARRFFRQVETVPQLLQAYQAAKASAPFECDVPEAMAQVDAYAAQFLIRLLDEARTPCVRIVVASS